MSESKRVIMCVNCGGAIPYKDSEDRKIVVDLMKQHDAKCSKNPLARKIRSALNKLNQMSTYANDHTIRLDIAELIDLLENDQEESD